MAEGLGLPVAEPTTGAEVLRLVKEAAADVGAVAAYGRLVGPRTIAQPKHGCVVVHASLLPQFRGAAPIQRAIMAGRTETGVTIIQMTPAYDEGPVLAQKSEPIEPDDTYGSLHHRLAGIAAGMLVKTIDRLAAGRLKPRPQDDRLATMAPILKPDDEILDFRRPAAALADQVRALNPWPVAKTSLEGRVLKVWRAAVAAEDAPLEPGTVAGVAPAAGATPNGLMVACGDGRQRLAFLEVQPGGGRPMPAADFVRGQRALVGSVLGLSVT
jgi:methionyl-tRNA formyltransferase